MKATVIKKAARKALKKGGQKVKALARGVQKAAAPQIRKLREAAEPKINDLKKAAGRFQKTAEKDLAKGTAEAKKALKSALKSALEKSSASLAKAAKSI